MFLIEIDYLKGVTFVPEVPFALDNFSILYCPVVPIVTHPVDYSSLISYTTEFLFSVWLPYHNHTYLNQ